MRRTNRNESSKLLSSKRALQGATNKALFERLEGRTMMSTVPVATGVPVLNSNPAASAKIFLDFNGAPAHYWDGGYNGWRFNVPATPAYDTDGDTTTFNNTGDSNMRQELDNIRQIWSRVAEKFSPFNVNVTTVDPGTYGDQSAMRVLVGGDGAWFNFQYGGGGASQQGSFTNATLDNVAYVFTQELGGDPAMTAERIAKEVGHVFNLNWQASFDASNRLTNSWSFGNSQIGPIMGNTMFAQRGMWWNGRHSSGAAQDDLSILSNTTNGFGYRTDDHGGSISAATAVTGTRSGIIERITDSDYFTFTTTGGSVTIDGAVAQYGAMLNLKLQLLNSSGGVVATADSAALGEKITTTLSAGTYYAVVSGHGAIACIDNNGVNQGSGMDLGQYTLTITAPTTPTTTIPVAPSGATGSAVSTSQINLYWNDNSNNETGFEIDRAANSTFTSGLVTTTAGANATSQAMTGLAAGTTYYFRVRATNSAGDSANSNIASATTTASVTTPTAPSGAAGSAVSTSQINLYWNDNSSNETGFEIDRATNSTFTSGLVSSTVGANVSSQAMTGLAAGTTYYFRVRSTNSAGDSANSNTASATTTAAVTMPAAPSGAAGTAVSTTQINLYWNDNSSNETGFEIDRATNSTFTSGLVTSTAGANASSLAMTGLAAGTTYYFRVRATNSAGDSANSNTASATTTAAVTTPTAPGNLAGTAISSTQVNLTWADYSSNETGFKVYRATDAGFTQNVTSVTLAVGATSYSATGLAASTTYYFMVRAVNSAGESSNSNTAAVTTRSAITLTVATPTNLTATATSGAVRVQWVDMSNNETGFTIQRSTNGGSTWSSLGNVGANVTSYTDSAIAAGTTYTYRTYAYAGTTASAISNTASIAPIPSAPTGLAATVLSSSQIRLNWTDVANETGYTVQRSTDGVNWTTAGTVGAGVLTYTASGLAANTNYSFRVLAGGLSASSASSNIATARTATATTVTTPAAPSNARKTTTGKKNVITWTDNSTNESNFVIQWSTNGTTWTTLTTLSANTTSYTHTGVKNPSIFKYRVAATNTAGWSAYSYSN